MYTIIKIMLNAPWPGSSEGCGFDPQLGHIEAATNECKNKWNDNSMFLSLPSSLSKNQ